SRTPSARSFSFSIRERAAHRGQAAIIVVPPTSWCRSHPEPPHVRAQSLGLRLQAERRLAHAARGLLVASRALVDLLEEAHCAAASVGLLAQAALDPVDGVAHALHAVPDLGRAPAPLRPWA